MHLHRRPIRPTTWRNRWTPSDEPRHLAIPARGPAIERHTDRPHLGRPQPLALRLTEPRSARFQPSDTTWSRPDPLGRSHARTRDLRLTAQTTGQWLVWRNARPLHPAAGGGSQNTDLPAAQRAAASYARRLLNTGRAPHHVRAPWERPGTLRLLRYSPLS